MSSNTLSSTRTGRDRKCGYFEAQEAFPRYNENPSTQQHNFETKEEQDKSQSETESETIESDASLSSEMSSKGFSDEDAHGDTTDDEDFLYVESEDSDESGSVADGDDFDGDDAPETSQQISQSSTHILNLPRRRDTTSICCETYAGIKSGASCHNTKTDDLDSPSLKQALNSPQNELWMQEISE
jgi:hypothetical protein